MSDHESTVPPVRGVSRRTLLQLGAGVAGAGLMPFSLRHADAAEQPPIEELRAWQALGGQTIVCLDNKACPPATMPAER